MNIIVKQLDEKAFEALKNPWAELLQKTSADRLFLSWSWQYTWWETWGKELDLELLLLAAYDEHGQLQGIAPLYRSQQKSKFFIRTTRIQFIGNNWRGVSTVRTEYLDFIVGEKFRARVVQSFFGYLETHKQFDELVICDVDKQSACYESLKNEQPSSIRSIREVDLGLSTQVSTQGDFMGYIQSLGKNTRLRIYNRRNYLSQKGTLEVVPVCESDLSDSFKLMNALHEKRWHKPLFSDVDLVFHTKLAQRGIAENTLQMSTLSVAGQIVSILYNYRVDGYEYYIQSGFDEGYDKKVSLGMLHLGYAIEQAFDDDISTFDLLIGEGKNSYYKSHFSSQSREVVTLQLVKSFRMHCLYKIYSLLWRP